MRHVLEGLDAKAVSQLNFPPVTKKKDRKKYLASVRSQVLGCHGCKLRAANDDTLPVPFRVEPKTRPRFVVVGGAPTANEMRRGVPFSDDLGKQLKGMFREAGLDWYAALFCNTVSCMPTDDGQKFRQPKKPEIMSCRENLLAQVEAGYTPYVLLVGGQALDAFRSDLTLVDHHGQCFLWLDHYVVMPIESPAGVEYQGRDLVRRITTDLTRWQSIVYSEDDPTQFMSEDCAWCEEWAVMWDRDGVAFCAKHWQKRGWQWKAERERFVDTGIEQLTF